MKNLIFRTKRTAAAVLTAIMCLGIMGQTVSAASFDKAMMYVPGYGEVDIDSLGLSEEMIQEYTEQAQSIDLSDPEAADQEIKEIAENAGYSISDSQAESIRGMLEETAETGMGAEEIQGMYEAYSGLNEAVQGTGDFFSAIRDFFVNIGNTIKNWFFGLFHISE